MIYSTTEVVKISTYKGKESTFHLWVPVYCFNGDLEVKVVFQ